MGYRFGLLAILAAIALLAPGGPAAQTAATTPGMPPAATTTARMFKSDLRPVPRLEGEPAARVDALLEGARLTRGLTRYESRSGPAGIVLGQSPAAGTPVRIGSQVDVVLSVAPRIPQGVPPATDRSPTAPAVDPMAALMGRLLQEALKTPAPQRAPESRPATPERVPESRAASPERVPESRPASPERVPEPRPANPERSVRVPDLVGRTLSSQASLLRDLRLGVDSVTVRDSVQAAGVVLEQRPPPQTQVRPGSMLAVVTSRGPPARVTVPDVVGLAETIAHERLAARKLPFEAREVASTRADGTVLAQSPAAGTEVAPGTVVKLQVSDGSLVTVPALAGGSAAAAEAALGLAGLRGEAETRESQAPPGQVLAQRPKGGSTLRRGSTVRYWTAVLRRMPVPELVGLTLDEAIGRLGADLRAEPNAIDSTSVAAGRIASQQPAPGTLVDAGASVRVQVSQGAPPLADLTGMDLAQAGAAVARAGARLGPPQQVFDAAAAGSVIGQTPAAGERLTPGSLVTPLVSRGPLWPWLAGAAAALALLAGGAAAAFWSPVRYSVRLETAVTGATAPAAPQIEGPGLVLGVRLVRGAAALVDQPATGDTS